IPKLKTPDNFRGHENVLRGLDEIAFGIAQKAKALPGYFNDAFAVLRFAGRLVAVLHPGLGPFRPVLARLVWFNGCLSEFSRLLLPARAFYRSILLHNIGVAQLRLFRFAEIAVPTFRITTAAGTTTCRAASPVGSRWCLCRVVFHIFAHS